MINGDFDAAEPAFPDRIFRFLHIQIFKSSGILCADSIGSAAYFFFVLQNSGASEGNYAAKLGGALPWHHFIPINDSKGNLVISADGIDFVACFRTVKTNRAKPCAAFLIDKA